MNPIKPTIKTEIWPILFILLAVASSFYFYANFPEQVPVHWNFAGEADRLGSRLAAAFLIPAMLIGIYLLFLFLPRLDPKKERYAQFSKVYHFFKAYIIFFMLAIYFIASLNGLGYNLAVGFWTPILIALLFIIIGNYLGKIKLNWFVGIKTPWTLSSEEVWNKTHRLGGKVFIIGGLLMAAESFLPVDFRMPLFAAIIIMILAGPVGYSYLVYLKEKKIIYARNNI